jgi:hypothetical protein
VYNRDMNNAAKTELNGITFSEIESALALFDAEGWTEMAFELDAAMRDGSEEGRGNLLRLVRHYRAKVAG